MLTTGQYRHALIRELWWQGYTLKQAALIASEIVTAITTPGHSTCLILRDSWLTSTTEGGAE